MWPKFLVAALRVAFTLSQATQFPSTSHPLLGPDCYSFFTDEAHEFHLKLLLARPLRSSIKIKHRRVLPCPRDTCFCTEGPNTRNEQSAALTQKPAESLFPQPEGRVNALHSAPPPSTCGPAEWCQGSLHSIENYLHPHDRRSQLHRGQQSQ